MIGDIFGFLFQTFLITSAILFFRRKHYNPERFRFNLLCWPVCAIVCSIPFALLMYVDILHKGWGQTLILVTTIASIMYLTKKYGPPNDLNDQLSSHGTASFGNQNTAVKDDFIVTKDVTQILQGSYNAFALGRVHNLHQDYDNRFFINPTHMLTCAPSRSGKGVSAVIPTLLTYPGSTIVLDVKGENYAVTRQQRRELGHKVYCIDPFKIVEQDSHHLNWLDTIDIEHEDCISAAAVLAEMLVIKSNDDSHWDDSAQDLIQGLILYVCTYEDETQKHIGSVREILTATKQARTKVFKKMSESTAAFGIIARVANNMLSREDREMSSIISTAVRHTGFLDDPRIVKHLSSSDFKLAELKQDKITIYLVIPPDKINVQSRFLRAFFGLSLNAVMANHHQPPEKVLFLMDEFAQLGYMQKFEDSLSVIMGYGAVFWIIVQDLSQLKFVYPKWQSFMANTSKQFFNTVDFETAQYISDTLGQTTIAYNTTSVGKSSTPSSLFSNTSESVSTQLHARCLLNPDEVMAIQKAIILIPNKKPYLLDKINYLNDEDYQHLYEHNPFHQTAPAEATA